MSAQRVCFCWKWSRSRGPRHSAPGVTAVGVSTAHTRVPADEDPREGLLRKSAWGGWCQSPEDSGFHLAPPAALS